MAEEHRVTVREEGPATIARCGCGWSSTHDASMAGLREAVAAGRRHEASERGGVGSTPVLPGDPSPFEVAGVLPTEGNPPPAVRFVHRDLAGQEGRSYKEILAAEVEALVLRGLEEETVRAEGRDPIEVYHPNEALSVRDPVSFEVARALVGGMVQAVPLDGGWYLLVHEEGRLRGLPENMMGWGAASAQGYRGPPPLGVVVLVPPGRVVEVLGTRG